MKRFCWQCGGSIPEAAVFCSHCGQRQATEEPSESPLDEEPFELASPPPAPDVPVPEPAPSYPELPRAKGREVAAFVFGLLWPFLSLWRWLVSPNPQSPETLSLIALYCPPAVIAYYVYKDMKRRPYPFLAGLSPIGWAGWVLVFYPVGIPFYLLLRRNPLTTVVWPRRLLPAATVLGVLFNPVFVIGMVAYFSSGSGSPLWLVILLNALCVGVVAWIIWCVVLLLRSRKAPLS